MTADHRGNRFLTLARNGAATILIAAAFGAAGRGVEGAINQQYQSWRCGVDQSSNFDPRTIQPIGVQVIGSHDDTVYRAFARLGQPNSQGAPVAGQVDICAFNQQGKFLRGQTVDVSAAMQSLNSQLNQETQQAMQARRAHFLPGQHAIEDIGIGGVKIDLSDPNNHLAQVWVNGSETVQPYTTAPIAGGSAVSEQPVLTFKLTM